MKFKLYSMVIVLFIAACLPNTSTPGMGNNPTGIPQAPFTLEATPSFPPSPTIPDTPTALVESATAPGSNLNNQDESPTAEESATDDLSTTQTAEATTAYLPLVKTATITAPPPGEALIADHRVVDLFPQIPNSALSRAIATKVLQKHASTGGYISGQGLNCLQGTSNHPDCTGYPDYKYDRRNWTWELWNPTEYAPWDKVTQFVSVVRARHNDYDVFAMKLCYIDVWPDGFPVYRDAMLELERQYPDKKFLWWTQALRPQWPSQNSCETIQTFNQQVREFALANNKPLLDIAAIESHAPNGSACSSGCESTCMEYAADPNNPQNGHPSRRLSIRIAKAYWWLMTRLTGWNGLAE